MNHGYFIGVMTGTSLDAIDIVIAEIGKKGKIIQIDYVEIPFSNEVQKFLKSITTVISIKALSQLNIRYTNEIASAISSVIKKNHLRPSQIKAIGLHGQTIWHQPDTEKFLGQEISSTYQLGSGTHLASLLGIDVISDFRTSDMAVGGQGAPLIPIFDFEFLSESSDVIVLNIGGISNITYLKSNGSKSDVIAYDTGPGNCLIDLLMNRYFNLNYDKDGLNARKGIPDIDILNRLMKNEYITRDYPKSTGKELFNLAFLEKYDVLKLSPIDAISTVTHFTAKSIAENIRKITKNEFILKISGGGAKNIFLAELLKEYIPNGKITKTIFNGIDITDSKEALLMVYLAYLRMRDMPANLPNVTGAKKEMVLGSIARGGLIL